MCFYEITDKWAKSALPKRRENSNKGTFGRLFAYVGSTKYMGACHLVLESALRGGAGYVELCAEREVWLSVLAKFPEIVYTEANPTSLLTEGDIARIAEAEKKSTAALIGCGSGASEPLRELTTSLINSSGGPLVIDADAINSLAYDSESAICAIKTSKRKIILTPHPLEFSRLCGLSVEKINEDRVFAAESFAKETASIVILKGNRTVITDGNKTYVNTSGSSALAKAGSGDCLAGLLSSLVATRQGDVLSLCALAAYIHGAAADNLSVVFSKYGVTPSDLPREMAKVIKSLE